jgi:hypothetical protein
MSAFMPENPTDCSSLDLALLDVPTQSLSHGATQCAARRSDRPNGPGH